MIQQTAEVRNATTVPWVLSGRSEAGLRAQAARLLTHAEGATAPDVHAVGRSLVRTGVAFEHRAVVLGRDVGELVAGARAVAEGSPAPNVVSGRVDGTRPGVVFVFPGQGTQWAGMAVGLLADAPVFAASVDACAEALAPHLDWSLHDVLRGAPDAPPLDRVDVVQPVLFTVMVSLAELWRSFGVTPAAVVGHSQGEIAAAKVAGALSLEDAARLVALRSQALTAIRGRGDMVTVLARRDRVLELLEPFGDRLAVAAVNGPATVTVSGDVEAMSEFNAVLRAGKLLRWRVPGVDFAAHSPHVADLREALLELAAGITPRASEVPFYSTVTGAPTPTTDLDAGYWYRNLRQTVRYDEATRALLADGHAVFLECSAQPVLTVGMQDTAEEAGRSAAFLATLRNGDGGLGRFLTAAAEVHVTGAGVDWSAVFPTTR
ncbi:acyltransferase domain-containing protein [Saccharothrix australiensis]|uniref:Polyketide synthase 12 n=1 Tax=Saccharothrix australiensis TaxID=2072 RepID=A0A495VZB0_9PSEU|nr:acyltransferase domain-containing protein [Saccharothrix australiensis]RKT53863.1 polyketide synthase 12 [Saccharothrix australiensis]